MTATAVVSALLPEQKATLRERFDRIESMLDAGAVPGYDETLKQLDATLAGMRVLDPLVPWMELEIGGVAADDHITQLEAADVDVGTYAKSVMRHPSYKPGERRTIALARCRVSDLGFTEAPTTPELLARVAQVAAVCPPEAAAHLRQALPEQPKGDWFSVMMEPIPDSDGRLFVLRVGRDDDGALYLHARYADPGRRWGLGREVVVALRSK
ncbi:MAG TPA: hypothetical protein VJ837_02990 [Candidatus Paceibacterota bacterium]|nr:hypothetical protein [Candidatus Paceibacterota bacterium]